MVRKIFNLNETCSKLSLLLFYALYFILLYIFKYIFYLSIDGQVHVKLENEILVPDEGENLC